jgi:hypothetical protein
VSGERVRPAAAALLLAVVAGAAPARAQDPLVAMGPITGARPALVRQLRQALCARVACVPWGIVSEDGRLDLARARAAGVDATLLGSVSGADRRVLDLSLFAGEPRPIARWRSRLEAGGTLPAPAVARLTDDLVRRVGRVAPRAPAAALPAPEPRGPAPAFPPEPRPPTPAARIEPAPDGDAPPAAEAAGPPASPVPWLGLEAGALLVRRSLSFPGAAPGPGPLRGHDVPGAAAPELRIELQPAAPWTEGALAGLSLQGRYAAAVGAVTAADGAARPTRMTWLSAGVAWRSAPPAGARTSLSAALSWERREVTVTPAIPGLADRRLAGPKVSAGLAVPTGPVSLFLRAGHVRWLEAPDLIAGRVRFFPGGAAWGLDAEAGLAIRPGGPWSLWLAGECAWTRYRLAPDPRGLYAARSARDDQFAGRLAVRLDL